MGNLPLHQLCKNTTSKSDHLMPMFWTLIQANEDAIRETNLNKKRPIDILARRLNIDDEGFVNPYEVNLDDIRELYEKMKMLEI